MVYRVAKGFDGKHTGSTLGKFRIFFEETHFCYNSFHSVIIKIIQFFRIHDIGRSQGSNIEAQESKTTFSGYQIKDMGP